MRKYNILDKVKVFKKKLIESYNKLVITSTLNFAIKLIEIFFISILDLFVIGMKLFYLFMSGLVYIYYYNKNLFLNFIYFIGRLFITSGLFFLGVFKFIYNFIYKYIFVNLLKIYNYIIIRFFLLKIIVIKIDNLVYKKKFKGIKLYERFLIFYYNLIDSNFKIFLHKIFITNVFMICIIFFFKFLSLFLKFLYISFFSFLNFINFKFICNFFYEFCFDLFFGLIFLMKKIYFYIFFLIPMTFKLFIFKLRVSFLVKIKREYPYFYGFFLCYKPGYIILVFYLYFVLLFPFLENLGLNILNDYFDISNYDNWSWYGRYLMIPDYWMNNFFDLKELQELNVYMKTPGFAKFGDHADVYLITVGLTIFYFLVSLSSFREVWFDEEMWDVDLTQMDEDWDELEDEIEISDLDEGQDITEGEQSGDEIFEYYDDLRDKAYVKARFQNNTVSNGHILIETGWGLFIFFWFILFYYSIKYLMWPSTAFPFGLGNTFFEKLTPPMVSFLEYYPNINLSLDARWMPGSPFRSMWVYDKLNRSEVKDPIGFLPAYYRHMDEQYGKHHLKISNDLPTKFFTVWNQKREEMASRKYQKFRPPLFRFKKEALGSIDIHYSEEKESGKRYDINEEAILTSTYMRNPNSNYTRTQVWNEIYDITPFVYHDLRIWKRSVLHKRDSLNYFYDFGQNYLTFWPRLSEIKSEYDFDTSIKRQKGLANSLVKVGKLSVYEKYGAEKVITDHFFLKKRRGASFVPLIYDMKTQNIQKKPREHQTFTREKNDRFKPGNFRSILHKKLFIGQYPFSAVRTWEGSEDALQDPRARSGLPMKFDYGLTPTHLDSNFQWWIFLSKDLNLSKKDSFFFFNLLKEIGSGKGLRNTYNRHIVLKLWYNYWEGWQNGVQMYIGVNPHMIDLFMIDIASFMREGARDGLDDTETVYPSRLFFSKSQVLRDTFKDTYKAKKNYLSEIKYAWLTYVDLDNELDGIREPPFGTMFDIYDYSISKSLYNFPSGIGIFDWAHHSFLSYWRLIQGNEQYKNLYMGYFPPSFLGKPLLKINYSKFINIHMNALNFCQFLVGYTNGYDELSIGGLEKQINIDSKLINGNLWAPSIYHADSTQMMETLFYHQPIYEMSEYVEAKKYYKDSFIQFGTSLMMKSFYASNFTDYNNHEYFTNLVSYFYKNREQGVARMDPDRFKAVFDWKRKGTVTLTRHTKKVGALYVFHDFFFEFGEQDTYEKFERARILAMEDEIEIDDDEKEEDKKIEVYGSRTVDEVQYGLRLFPYNCEYFSNLRNLRMDSHYMRIFRNGYKRRLFFLRFIALREKSPDEFLKNIDKFKYLQTLLFEKFYFRKYYKDLLYYFTEFDFIEEMSHPFNFASDETYFIYEKSDKLLLRRRALRRFPYGIRKLSIVKYILNFEKFIVKFCILFGLDFYKFFDYLEMHYFLNKNTINLKSDFRFDYVLFDYYSHNLDLNLMKNDHTYILRNRTYNPKILFKRWGQLFFHDITTGGRKKKGFGERERRKKRKKWIDKIYKKYYNNNGIPLGAHFFNLVNTLDEDSLFFYSQRQLNPKLQRVLDEFFEKNRFFLIREDFFKFRKYARLYKYLLKNLKGFDDNLGLKTKGLIINNLVFRFKVSTDTAYNLNLFRRTIAKSDNYFGINEFLFLNKEFDFRDFFQNFFGEEGSGSDMFKEIDINSIFLTYEMANNNYIFEKWYFKNPDLTHLVWNSLGENYSKCDIDLWYLNTYDKKFLSFDLYINLYKKYE